MTRRNSLAREFQRLYGCTPRQFSAPGRVNLIGEHTDYNCGFVLPMAIEPRTYVAGSSRADRLVSVHSMATGTGFVFDLDRPGARRRGTYLDYVEGTAQALMAGGYTLCGADLLIESEVPMGAGLSASAALEMSVAYALTKLSGIAEPDLLKLALAGQTAEHTYVGTMCGIMDQYVVALAKSAHALLIDCRSLQGTPVPLALGSACVLVCDTRVKHELASSAYNRRRQECEQGVAVLARLLPEVRSLRDVTTTALRVHAAWLPGVTRKRCAHVVTENERTLGAVAALHSGDFASLGTLMTASHLSLRDDYEVSCAELDEAVATALAQPGVYGARMTGGGFGGCTVTLLERTAVDAVSSAIQARFAERFGTIPNLFATRASSGVAED